MSEPIEDYLRASFHPWAARASEEIVALRADRDRLREALRRIIEILDNDTLHEFEHRTWAYQTAEVALSEIEA